MNDLLETNKFDRSLASIYSFLFWGGFMNKDQKDVNKYIFKMLNLDRFCDKTICNYYKDIDKHADFFKQYEKNEELRAYIADQLSIFAYKNLAEKTNNDELFNNYVNKVESLRNKYS